MTPVPNAKIAEWEQAVRKLTAVKDNKILEAAAARKETRKAAAAKVQDMLAQTGRTRLDDKDTDETARKKREETFLHGVSERVEQASNTTFIAEDVASKVADGPPMAAPVKGPVFNAYANEALVPQNQKAQWLKQKEQFEVATAQKALQDKVALGLTAIKATDADHVTALKASVRNKLELAKKKAGIAAAPTTAEIDTAADGEMKRVLVFNEVDAEIEAAVKAYDVGHAAVDPETRQDEVAKIIENIGGKYGYDNLAHFISRHGAARTNPATGDVKRTATDFVSRLATGVGPDRKNDNPPVGGATVTAPRADGTNVTVPKYAKVGFETTNSASQHSSAKAALFMIEEAMAEAGLMDELTGAPSEKMDVTVGKEDLGGQKLGSYEEPGKLGTGFKLKGTAGVPTLSKAKRGKPLNPLDIAPRIGDTEVVPNQDSAKVTLLKAKMLGGYNVMTMFSQATAAAQVEYTQGGVKQTLPKTSANVEAQRKAVMTGVRDQLGQEKTEAESELATAKLAADAAAKEATDAGGAVDAAIGKLDPSKQNAAKDLKKSLLEETSAAEAVKQAGEAAKDLAEENKRLSAQVVAAVKDIEAKTNAVKTAKPGPEREEAEYQVTVAQMNVEEIEEQGGQLAKLLATAQQKLDTCKETLQKAEAARKDTEAKAGLDAKELGDLKGLFTELEKKQKAALELGEEKETAAKVVKFYAEQHAQADRQVKIATHGHAEVLRQELEDEAKESKAALAFDGGKETASEYEERLKSFETGQRAQIDEQRKRLQADKDARAAHGKERRDEVRPAQAAATDGPGEPSEEDSGKDPDMIALAKRVEKIQGLIDGWQTKADGGDVERDAIGKEQLKLKTEYEALKAKKGEDHTDRLNEIAEENEALQKKAADIGKRRNIALHNVNQLADKQKEFKDQWAAKRKVVLESAADTEEKKPTKTQKSNVETDKVADELDGLRNGSGLASIDLAEAELELRVAEAKANVGGASELVKARKEAAQLKKTLMDAKAKHAAGQLAEKEAKAKYDKMKAVADDIDKLVVAGTLPATEPRVVDLKNRLTGVKDIWDKAVTAVADADKAVKAATGPYDAKAKEVSEKEAKEKAKMAV
jgi:hypothetical protein